MIPQQVMKQRNLMRQALVILNDISALERNFNEDVLINLKIERLQEQYAETVTELAKLLMNESINCL